MQPLKEKHAVAGAEQAAANVETSEIETKVDSRRGESRNMKLKLKKLASRALSIKISILFIVPGILSLVLSVVVASQVLALIGLSLTFWGALFLLVRPTTYVRGNLLEATVVSTYLNIDRMIADMKLEGRSFYIPPYPRDVYLPEHLKGLKEMIVFVSAESNAVLPSIEETAKSRFMLEHPRGINIIPPGLGLADQIEKELKTDPTKMDLDTLCEILSQLIPESFQMTKEIQIRRERNQIGLRITDSVYRELYTRGNLRSLRQLGCPLVSAIACELAKASGKVVTIPNLRMLPDGKIIEVSYQLAEG
jgi:hypothetical protein